MARGTGQASAELTYINVNSKHTTEEEVGKLEVREIVWKVCASIGRESFSETAHDVNRRRNRENVYLHLSTMTMLLVSPCT